MVAVEGVAQGAGAQLGYQDQPGDEKVAEAAAPSSAEPVEDEVVNVPPEPLPPLENPYHGDKYGVFEQSKEEIQVLFQWEPCDDYFDDGDMSFYTRAALTLRRNMRHDPYLLELIDKFWYLYEEAEGQEGRIGFKEYGQGHKRIFRALREDCSGAVALATAQQVNTPHAWNRPSWHV